MTYERVPRACAQADAIVADSQTADTVVMTDQGTDLLPTSDIPNLTLWLASALSNGIEPRMIESYLALKIIIPSKEQSSRYRRSYGGDTTED